MNDIDKKLQQLASTDWKTFMQVIGEDSLITAKARMLRIGGKSYQQISIKLEISPKQARYACNKTKLPKIDELDITK